VSTVFRHHGEPAIGDTLVREAVGFVPRSQVFGDVRNFGATGDGVTDDTAAILQALAQGDVVFPRGTYLVAGSAFAPVFALTAAGTTVKGERGAVVKLAATTPVGTYVFGVQADDVTIDGLTIDGSGIASAIGIAFRVADSAGALVTRNRFVNFHGGSAAAGVFLNDNATDIRIHNNRFSNYTYGVLSGSTRSPTHVAITTNIFNANDVAGDGISINSPTGDAGYFTITGNDVRGSATSGNNGIGIALAHVVHATIKGNTVSGCGLDGIHVEDGGADIVVSGNDVSACGRSGITAQYGATNTTKRIVVTGNTVNGCLTVSGSYGIEVSGSSRMREAIVADNTVHGCGRAAATCYGIGLFVQNAVVHDNIVSNTTGGTTGGILVATCIDTSVHHNRCFDDQGSPTQDHGIVVTGAQVRVRIEDNDVAGNGTAGIDESGIGALTDYKRRRNIGFVTENDGTGSIASGATTATVTHGLAVTPAAKDIRVVLTENPTNDPGIVWIDTIGATTFAVNCRSDPGASNLDFAWRAEAA
jgi:parallel beta-helix repeat protein